MTARRPADAHLLDAAMDAWPWACGDEPDGARGATAARAVLQQAQIPGPRWRQRMRQARVPRPVIRALARRFQGKPPPESL